ncbi:ribosomal protein S18-alanine N-acetyltransferase [Streptococcaceae bacterium ESL0687]|nr:ribosomal protein S18-alanine N-acetyltransferase [Streptococcaceae bacterium ESL0687]
MDKRQVRIISHKEENCKNVSASIHDILCQIYEISPWTLEQVESDLRQEQSIYFFACKDDRAVGFLAATELMGEIEITNLAVHPDFQGQGLSSKLLERLLDFEATFFLEVRKSNVIAQNLYKKFKFESFHERKKYYKNPTEDAILMRLERL